MKIESAFRTWMLAAISFGIIGAMSSASAMAQTLTLASVDSNGTNISLGTAQFVDLVSAANLALFNADLAKFNNSVNGDTVHQMPPNFSLGSAQPVSPQFFPLGAPSVPVSSDVAALGTIGSSSPQAFYSFSAAAGDNLHFAVSATQPAARAVQVLLYDNNNNLVAVANGNAPGGLGSFIDFTVPTGSSGTWITEVSSGDGNPAPFKYGLHLGLPYSATSGFTTQILGGTANPMDATDLGIYSFNTNVGDYLTLTVSAIPTASRGAELLLYDNNGNLVAAANGNQPDALSSFINFTIPTGDGGIWYAEVQPGDGNPKPFPYELTIQGPTGFGPVNPLPPVGVPEPGSWPLLVTALVGILRVRSVRSAKPRTPRPAAFRGPQRYFSTSAR